MIGRHWGRRALPGIIVATLTFAGCSGDNNPYGVPYYDYGRLLAGVYQPITPGTNQDMRLVLGRRHTLTGRYEAATGETVRFEGTWERVGDVLTVHLNGSGVPSSIDLGFARETVLTELPRGPFSQQPENEKNFLEADVMRLRGTAVVGGFQIDLDLARIITDVVTIGGGGQN